jgi:Protein of unknown function (DUF2690)
VPRPERAIDPRTGPVAQFADGLRELRRSAGSPTYRQMAGRVHYSAAALARAASGISLPTLDLALAYVTACGGDQDAWRARWRSAAQQAEMAGNGLPPGPKREAAATRRRRYRWLLAGCSAGIIVLAAAVVAISLRPSPHSRAGNAAPAAVWLTAHHILPLPASASQPRSDGADPARNGCAEAGAVTLDHVNIWLGRVILGQVELRYSATCKAAWARMSPAGALINNPSQRIRVRLETFRPADSTASRSDDAFVRDFHWAGMLSTRAGCVIASGTIDIGDQQTALVRTRCMPARGRG